MHWRAGLGDEVRGSSRSGGAGEEGVREGAGRGHTLANEDAVEL